MKQDLIWDYFQNRKPEAFEGSKARIAWLARRITRGSKVLNIGVGTGIFEGLSFKYGFEAYSLDPSKKSIETLRQRYSMGERARTGYSQAIPFESAFFDAVVVSEVFEHLSDEVLDLSLAEISRVLNGGGLLAATVPSRENLDEQTAVCPDCGKTFHRWGHVQIFDPARIRKLLEKHSFSAVEMTEKPVISWPDLNFKGKALGFVKLCLRHIGIHGAGETILLTARKPQSENAKSAGAPGQVS